MGLQVQMDQILLLMLLHQQVAAAVGKYTLPLTVQWVKDAMVAQAVVHVVVFLTQDQLIQILV
jgi:hypothetical protein